MITRPSNPFHYGDLALDEAFTNRETELRALQADLRNGQNVAIIAPRRYGKSSLVRRASQDVMSEGLIVVEVDLMKTPTKEKLASKLARSIYDDLATVVFKAKEGLRVFSGLRITPTITIDPTDGTPSFSFATSHAEQDIDATLERLLELPAQLAAERGKKVALYFDEFQEITSIDPKLPSLMRAVFQEQPDVSHVYCGSKRHMMLRLFNDENEPFFKSAKIVEIGRIGPDAFSAFIKQRFDGTDRRLPDAEVDELLQITDGHPYATQELAYALWEEVPEGFSASSADLHRALEAVLRAETPHFTLLWEKASRAQRLVLQALAVEPGRLQSGGYIAKHGLPAAATVQKAAVRLTEEELIGRVDGRFEIVEPFLKEWIAAYGS